MVYGFQDTRMLDGNLDRINLFASLGVRVIQLTYNRRELFGDGCLEAGNAGLSQLGLDAVLRLNELKVLVDLAHCGQQTTADAIEHSKVPVAISHTGCQALANLPRNKRDVELRRMAERGGVVGIYLMPFLTPGRQPTADDVIQHIEHALQVCGEDHVGIGSDCSITPHVVNEEYRATNRRFVRERQQKGIAAPGEDPDLYFFVPELNSARRLQLIADRLSIRGHSDVRIEKIMGGNWVRLLRDVWGDA
jgi:membrane dipeptidase